MKWFAVSYCLCARWTSAHATAAADSPETRSHLAAPGYDRNDTLRYPMI
jgi:hypothetical protein